MCEYEPAFVDVAIRHWQAYAKSDAILDDDGRTFDAIAEEQLKANERPALPASHADPQHGPCEALGEKWVELGDLRFAREPRDPEAAP